MLMTAPFYVSTTFFTLSYNSLSDVDNSGSELVPRLNLQSMIITPDQSSNGYVTVTAIPRKFLISIFSCMKDSGAREIKCTKKLNALSFHK